jgi:hypothetical protein
MSTTEQWYIGQRAEALTKVLLTRRTDLIITSLQEEERGLDYRVEITPEGQPTGRIFGIQVKARIQALQKDTQLRLNGHTDGEKMTTIFPVCLFYFTMEDNGAYYRWLIEPIITNDQAPKLSKVRTNEFHKLDSEEINHIITRINDWYEHLQKTLSL